jgi:tRNA A-37 threonylcarbamoyl transferase component Bud32
LFSLAGDAAIHIGACGAREGIVDTAVDPSLVEAEQRWGETLRMERPEALTPSMSITAGRAHADADLAQRVLSRARARVASAGGDGDADYLLGELIGAGGMGQVYQATQVALERTVAVKVLRAELLANPAAREEFLAEALVTADLDHPNTVPVYEIGLTHEAVPFYAMKLVRGTRWSQALPANSLERNLDILLAVCDAVTFAHDKGVIHRDLKPENVMVGPYGEVLLMDWGLAAGVGNPRARPLNAGSVCAGTPAYMPPEVASCAVGRIGKASDGYLLGGILYEIVTGLTPHTGSDVIRCLAAAMRNELQPTEKNGELLGVALRAMHTDPAQRYPSVKEFASAVRDFLSHQLSLSFSEQASQRFAGLIELDREDFYRACDEIIALYQRALACWSGNRRAAEGLIRIRETLTAIALRRGEIQLARSQARAAERERAEYGVPELPPDSTVERIKSSLSARDRRV